MSYWRSEGGWLEGTACPSAVCTCLFALFIVCLCLSPGGGGLTQRCELSLRRVIMKPLCAASHVVTQTEAAIVLQSDVQAGVRAGRRRGEGERRGNWSVYQRKTTVLSSLIWQTAPRPCRKAAGLPGDGRRWVFPIFTTSKRDFSEGRNHLDQIMNSPLVWGLKTGCDLRPCPFSWLPSVTCHGRRPRYCTLSRCCLNKRLLDVRGAAAAINLFTFN